MKYKPRTPSLRWKKNIKNFKGINLFNSNLFKFKKNKSGRNTFGQKILNTKIKNNFIYSNFYFNLWNSQSSIIISIKKNYNRNFFSLIKYKNGSISLFKHCYGLFFSDFIYSYKYIFYKNYDKLLGIVVWLFFLKVHLLIYNVSFKTYGQSKIASAPGTYCQIIEINKEANFIKVKLPSNNYYLLNKLNLCNLGRNNNLLHKYINIGKAGINIISGKKVTVRGVAKNPVDHPHGGRTKTNCPEISPWGWVTKHSH